MAVLTWGGGGGGVGEMRDSKLLNRLYKYAILLFQTGEVYSCQIINVSELIPLIF